MNLQNLDTVFFDLDGTLVDNYDAITACVGDSIAPLGFERPTREHIKRIVGGSIITTMEKLVGKDLAETAGKSYMEKIGPLTFFGLKKMHFASEILINLNAKNLRCVCLTNKSQKSTEEILEKLNLASEFFAIIGTSLLGPHKPSKEFTAAAAQKVGTSADKALLIGDSVYDYQTAQNFVMPCLLVATGGDTLGELKTKCPKAFGVYENLEKLYNECFKI